METIVTSESRLWSRVLEWLAVLSNLAFTVLYLNHSAWSFFFGVLGPLLLLWIGLRSRLYADPLLQVVYVISAVVGYFNVSEGWYALSIGAVSHGLILLLTLVFTWGLGTLLRRKTNAAMPYVDSLTTALGIVGTWLMMYQVHACWLYLMAVNVLSIFLFYRRRLYAATLMFVLYFILSVDGYFTLHWFEL